MKHGTHTAYQAGCRCIDCRDFVRDYSAKRRNLGNPNGVVVSTSVRALRSSLMDAGLSYEDIAGMFGISSSSVWQEVNRGRMGLYRLDAIACALGTHLTTLMADPDEYVSREAS